jgi:hypothetical protein
MFDFNLESEDEPEEIVESNSVLMMMEDQDQLKSVAVDFMKKLSASTIAHAVNFTIDYLLNAEDELDNVIDVTPE